MRFRKAKPQPTNPTWIFSTWPIPTWDGHGSYIRLAPSGANDTPQIQKASERLAAISGTLLLVDGVFRLSDPVVLEESVGAVIHGNVFLNETSSKVEL
jgi:hypothetical protein